MRKIAEHIAGACRAGEPLVLVAVAESKDSTPRKAGTLMLVSADGLVCGTIGGGALGLIEGALLLFLVCDVAPKLGVKAFADYEGTYLLSFFMSHTPRGLVAALLP